MKRTVGTLVLIALVCACPIGRARTSEAASITHLVVIDASGAEEFSGTGFIVSHKGVLVTNAHVVETYTANPTQHSLLALFGGSLEPREWYSADLICAVPVPPHSGAEATRFSKDIAILKLAAPFADRAWGFSLPAGQRYDYQPHEGPLPDFPALTLASSDAHTGDKVHTTGYSVISALPRLFTTSGTITDTFTENGAPILAMEFPNPIQPGASGSPILNGAGEVVGIETLAEVASGDPNGKSWTAGPKTWAVAASAFRSLDCH
jgi:S1-C subfamily serine protease